MVVVVVGVLIIIVVSSSGGGWLTRDPAILLFDVDSVTGFQIVRIEGILDLFRRRTQTVVVHINENLLSPFHILPIEQVLVAFHDPLFHHPHDGDFVFCHNFPRRFTHRIVWNAPPAQQRRRAVWAALKQCTREQSVSLFPLRAPFV